MSLGLGYPSRASRVMASGLASLALLLGLAAPVEAATVNWVEGVWATGGGTNPALVATGSDTNIGIILTPKGTGGVGISTTSPQSLLHVYGGEVQVGSSGASCAAANNGAVRFSGTTLYYCTGTTWTAIGAGGSATLNGITAATDRQGLPELIDVA
jgi:hypothetical protein